MRIDGSRDSLRKGKLFIMAKTMSATRETAESLAIQALTYIAQDPDRLARFLALCGIEPGAIRAAVREAGFLAGVLEYIGQDEGLLVAFAADAGMQPGEVDKARAALAGAGWERDVP